MPPQPNSLVPLARVFGGYKLKAVGGGAGGAEQGDGGSIPNIRFPLGRMPKRMSHFKLVVFGLKSGFQPPGCIISWRLKSCGGLGRIAFYKEDVES